MVEVARSLNTTCSSRCVIIIIIIIIIITHLYSALRSEDTERKYKCVIIIIIIIIIISDISPVLLCICELQLVVETWVYEMREAWSAELL